MQDLLHFAQNISTTKGFCFFLANPRGESHPLDFLNLLLSYGFGENIKRS